MPDDKPVEGLHAPDASLPKPRHGATGLNWAALLQNRGREIGAPWRPRGKTQRGGYRLTLLRATNEPDQMSAVSASDASAPRAEVSSAHRR